MIKNLYPMNLSISQNVHSIPSPFSSTKWITAEIISKYFHSQFCSNRNWKIGIFHINRKNWILTFWRVNITLDKCWFLWIEINWHKCDVVMNKKKSIDQNINKNKYATISYYEKIKQKYCGNRNNMTLKRSKIIHL